MDSQELIKTIEELKKAGFIYNDSDFCRKLGFPKSFLSERWSGSRPWPLVVSVPSGSCWVPWKCSPSKTRKAVILLSARKVKKAASCPGVALCRSVCRLWVPHPIYPVLDEVGLAASQIRSPLLDEGCRLWLEAEADRLALLVSLGGSSVGVVGVSFWHD